MEAKGKIKVKIVLKEAKDNASRITVDNNQQTSAKEIIDLLEALGQKTEVESTEKVVNLLESVKHGHEVKALSLIDVNLDELFEKEMEAVDNIDELINFVTNL